MIISKLVISILFFSLVGFIQKSVPQLKQNEATKPAHAKSSEYLSYDRQIAHAGGALNGKAYTNSQEAIEASYAVGYRMFEVDLNLTTDDTIVLLHDWNDTYYSLTGQRGARDKESFMLDGKNNGYTFLTINDLCHWATKHNAIQIILDTKIDTIGTLAKISKDDECPKNQLIPFIYNLDQYQVIKRLGFSNLILLSKGMDNDSLLQLGQIKDGNFSLAASQTTDTDTIRRLAALNLRIYIWTVDSVQTEKEFRDAGAYGVITNQIKPAYIKKEGT